ncbi:MAG: DNA cytosine methyltransferase, partial [Deferribacteraceae bacterium]|nr:DNA cytosine methyltransferase [Deferribacteraceae bacterium]
MTFLSICSGVEAASVAWSPLGFKAVAFSEVDPFCNTLLKCCYPEVENIGDLTHADFTRFRGRFDILIGGTPCQSFSTAGKRQGARDKHGGWDFFQFLTEISKCGYGFVWRVLDARFFGVPQSRRRVFLIGHFGDWRPPAKVLFEQESPSWDDWQSKKKQHKNSAMDDCAKTLLTSNQRTAYFNGGHQGKRIYPPDISITLSSAEGSNKGLYKTAEGIRRLTPLEYERCQGFPDNYTAITYRGKPASDTQRY